MEAFSETSEVSYCWPWWPNGPGGLALNINELTVYWHCKSVFPSVETHYRVCRRDRMKEDPGHLPYQSDKAIAFGDWLRDTEWILIGMWRYAIGQNNKINSRFAPLISYHIKIVSEHFFPGFRCYPWTTFFSSRRMTEDALTVWGNSCNPVLSSIWERNTRNAVWGTWSERRNPMNVIRWTQPDKLDAESQNRYKFEHVGRSLWATLGYATTPPLLG